MDRLMTMTTFVRVVKYASFTAAAEDLGISRTLVSRHIADLEAHLGVRLLHRTTRTVTPTRAGQEYHALCMRVLTDIEVGEEGISTGRDQIKGDIDVLCPIWIGSFGVSGATAQFCAENPGVRIRLQFAEPSNNPHDFLDRGFDICIQPSFLRDSSIMVKKIGEIDFVLVASPSYLAIRGEPENVQDLAKHDCLPKLADGDWVFLDGERASLRGGARFSTNSVFSLCTAAVAGLGIAMLPDKIAERDLNLGALRTVLPQRPLGSRPLYVAYAPGGDVPQRVSALIAYLADWFRDQRGPQSERERVARAFDERPSE